MTMLKIFNIFNKSYVRHLFNNNKTDSRHLWGYVAVAFNRVDADRLKLVGPDRLCAEWMIKNGGAIRTTDAPHHLMRDYNTLPPEDCRLRIKVVDATGSSIMKIGLEHFKGCSHIDTAIFHQCKHLESDGLQGLLHLNNTLKELQVSECDNISDEGLMVIEEMVNLRLLRLFNMRYVKNLDDIKLKLKKSLPNCLIDTMPVLA